MKYRMLGATGIRVSAIGLGCASYWGKPRFPEHEAMHIVHAALDEGITLFDTGHSYSEGYAEPRLGKALRCVPCRNELAVSTKAGTRIGPRGTLYKDFTPAWIRHSCIESLRRLGLEALPMFQLHGPQIGDLTDELLCELERLKAEGLIRVYGVNTFDTEVIETIIRRCACDFVMLDYNILAQDREPMIARLHVRGIGCLAGAPLGDSLYSNRVFRIRGMKDLWYCARAVHNFRGKILKGLRFRFVNHVKEYTGAQISLAYVLANELVAAAVFGTTSEAHLRENVKAADIVMPWDLERSIRAADGEHVFALR